MDVNSAHYSLQAVAMAVGVEPNTLRAWESRYKVVEPQRSSAGHRRYTQEAVDRLQKVAGLVRKGHAISEVARLRDDELSRLAVSQAASGSTAAVSRAVQVRLDALLDAVQRYDLTAAASAVKWLRTATGARKFVLDVAVPLFHKVGELVASSSLDVSQEHALSAILRDQLGDLLQTMQALATPTAAGRKFVFATPEDDFHEFGIMLGAVLAAAHGLDVLYAGANLPVSALVRVVDSCSPYLIVLGNAPVPPSERQVSFEEYLEALDARIPYTVNIFVGGQGDRPLRTCASGRSVRYLNSLQELDGVWSTLEEE